jgi:DNA-binding NarL/FixJ family response regulator
MPASEGELLVARESAYTRLVLLSEQESPGSDFDHAQSLMEHSVARQTSVEQLVQMVRNVYRREDRKTCSAPEPTGEAGSVSRQEGALTARERQVLKLLAEGKTVRGAATDLGLSSKTVDAHKFNLMRKLGIHNKAELVMWAIQKRVVKIPA